MNNLEPYVEYHGWVTLKNAIDSHATGLKGQFRLNKEDDLDTFKSITKRRKGRAGQIYRMHFRPTGDEDFKIADIFFLGATWSHNSGTIVAFEFSEKSEWQEFRDWPGLAGGNKDDAKEIEIVLFRVTDDGKLMNIQQRDAIERIQIMKGGPQSIRAARLCKDGEFMDYLTSEGLVESTSPETAAKYVMEKCGIGSRKELDHDPEALDRFNKLVMSPFIKWSV